LNADPLEELARSVVQKSLHGGASDAECTILERTEFSVSIRMREVENVKEAGSRGAGVRVLKGKRSGSSYTSDLSPQGLERMVESALELASVTSEDPYAGLPEPEELGSIDGELNLYYDDVAALEAAEKIRRAREAEEAALSFDPRITNSEGSSFDSNLGRRVFANSRDFIGSYRTSSCSLSVLPVARDGDTMERDYWFTLARTPQGLESPDQVGKTAASSSEKSGDTEGTGGF
jgi:PmbA protein